jgi:hypothetical protein
MSEVLEVPNDTVVVSTLTTSGLVTPGAVEVLPSVELNAVVIAPETPAEVIVNPEDNSVVVIPGPDPSVVIIETTRPAPSPLILSLVSEVALVQEPSVQIVLVPQMTEVNLPDTPGPPGPPGPPSPPSSPNELTITVSEISISLSYYGGTMTNGSWKVNRWVGAVKTSATLINNPSYANLSLAWVARTSLVYS